MARTAILWCRSKFGMCKIYMYIYHRFTRTLYSYKPYIHTCGVAANSVRVRVNIWYVYVYMRLCYVDRKRAAPAHSMCAFYLLFMIVIDYILYLLYLFISYLQKTAPAHSMCACHPLFVIFIDYVLYLLLGLYVVRVGIQGCRVRGGGREGGRKKKETEKRERERDSRWLARC